MQDREQTVIVDWDNDWGTGVLTETRQQAGSISLNCEAYLNASATQFPYENTLALASLKRWITISKIYFNSLTRF